MSAPAGIRRSRATSAATTTPRRILYYTSFFSSQGGASILFLKLLEAFNREGFEAHALLPAATRAEVAKLKNAATLCERIIYLPIARISRRLFNPAQWLPFFWNALHTLVRMRRLLRQYGIALVHANDMRDFHAPLAAWSLGIPVVWHLRASRSNPLLRLPFAWLFHLFATKIIASSRRNGEQMLLHASHAQNKVTVIYDPGPYRERFHPGVRGENVRRELGLPPDAPVFTLIAKYSPRKGHLLFLEAMATVLPQFPAARFVIVGGELPGHEGYARKIRQCAERFLHSQNLVLTGERSDVPELIAASDVLVHCSLYDDPFPGVVMEGMAVGRVVIGCAAGGVPEQITHGQDGLLFRMGDARDLADQMKFALTHPDKMQSLRAAAIESLEQKFSFDKSRRGLARLYREVLGMAASADQPVRASRKADVVPIP